MAMDNQKASKVAISDDERWAMVVSREQGSSADFFYSVRTTGIYCRPGCAARLAHRKNVQFHSTCEEAEQEGFRPCKRCCPNEPPRVEQHTAAMVDICRLIETAFEPPNLDALAKSVGMSRFHFHRTFKAIVGVTPKAYAKAHRARRVREELPQRATVTEALYEAGFNSSGRFYASSTDALGMTPSEFRSGGTDAAIRFAVGECSLGSVLVAATTIGVCSILLGDDPDNLIRDLERRFPLAELTGADENFKELVARVVGCIEEPMQEFDLPLDVRGSVFQQRVWQALRELPVGSTATYKEIAERLGSPKSARAVARACATNPIAIAIPCHRVVRQDGGLSGYRWGIERKRALRDRESTS